MMEIINFIPPMSTDDEIRLMAVDTQYDWRNYILPLNMYLVVVHAFCGVNNLVRTNICLTIINSDLF